jgi:hypothetical protein
MAGNIGALTRGDPKRRWLARSAYESAALTFTAVKGTMVNSWATGITLSTTRL